MKRQEAIQLIDSTFNKTFDEDRFTLFVKNFLNDIDTDKYNEYKGNLIKDAFKDHVSQYKRIGKYIDPNGEALDVLIVEVKDQTKLDRARTALRNFVISHLDSFEKDYALIAFYSKSDHGADWRFSYVKLEYRSEVKEGKIKQRKELTPAKRYSFLVGELEQSHTAKSQLLPLLQNVYNNPTLEQIEEAFSIEAVTDEFFEQYKLLFGKLVEQFNRDNTLLAELSKNNIDTPRFAKKLLGQIVFLYFLQKKGWLGVPKSEGWGKGDKKFLQSLFDQAENKSQNFFAQYLQVLFYDALAREHHDDGVKGYFRKLNSRIPFLNGGLFEADYDWETANIIIPNTLFRNNEPLKSGDVGTGILDVFDRYNFTIKEDEPLEKEVAVDPEMLGKVFENMLEVTERKSKGAFYTPREIVHYMCQESLIHYLNNSVNDYNTVYQGLGNDQLALLPDARKGKPMLNIEHRDVKVPRSDIEEFIRHGFFGLENDQRVIRTGKETSTYKFQLPESVRTHADALDKHLSTIKICDPAIGSGAFPVGLLLELVNAQLVLKQYLSPAYFEKKLKSVGLTKADYEANESSYLYRLKRHTIQESIYGVDIDASAIDVARLRLWLSLVVDEEDLDNIEALPNLDYKIVCGNSLIGLPDTVMRDLTVQKEVEILKDDFFTITDEAKKRTLRNTINKKIRQLMDSAEQFTGYKIDFDFKLFFSEVWRQKRGFDIVIGNPPYVRVQELDKQLVTIYKEIYDSATGSFDIYLLFAEKGVTLFNDQGQLNYIMPHKWTNSAYGEGFRKLVSKGKFLSKLISFDAFQVFKAATYTSIITLDKGDTPFKFIRLKHDILSLAQLQRFLTNINSESYTEYNRKIGQQPLELVDMQIKLVLDKAKNNSIALFDIAEKIFQGIKTSKDSIYILKDVNNVDSHFIRGFSEELGDFVIIEKEICRPLLKGSDFHRYETIKTDKVVVLPYLVKENGYRLYEEDELKESFPLAYDYLMQNKETLKNRESGKLKNDPYWYKFIYPKNILSFPKEKIIISEVSYGSNMIFDSNQIHHVGQYSLLLRDPSHQNYLATLLILNAEFTWFFIKSTGSVLRGGYYAYRPDYLCPLPFPKVSEEQKRVASILSLYLIETRKAATLKLLYTYFEMLGNSLVYEFYFPTQIYNAGKHLFKHLVDVTPVSNDMSDEIKLSIIQNEFERLYNPSHPVRNAVETLDGVEEVRVIRETLRK